MQPEIREDRPPYVRFERRPVEDRTRSLESGVYATKDVDFAIVTPAGSRDTVERVVEDWFTQLDRQARDGRVNPQWVKMYKEAYAAWQSGQEIPLNGTPIKGWGLLSPSQQENCIRCNVKTVEDLAQLNEDGQRRLGMGALDWRNKAAAWIKAHKAAGPLAAENAALKARVEAQEQTIVKMQQTLEELKTKLETKEEAT